MNIFRLATIAGLLGQLSFGQLTEAQKVLDFQSLASLYAKRYAPYAWKKQLLGVDPLDIKPWLERVRNSKDDLEYFEIAGQYVAQLDDAHTSYVGPSRFFAYANFSVDIYDGKVLVEAISRTVLPADKFPFEVGDELVSVDGKPVEMLIDEYSKLQRMANPVSTRRAAADLLTFRPQYTVPRASELGETSSFVFLRANGELETYEIPWTKTGIPLTSVGPVPDLRAAVKDPRGAAVPDYMQPWMELTNFGIAPMHHLTQGETWSAELGANVPRRYLLGWGSRAPTFAMPSGFQVRLGRFQSDFHFSGVYQADGLRIGYLRIPSFSPPSSFVALFEIANEVEYLKANTDGLVVDVMRNPGGTCYMLDVAAYLIPKRFSFFGQEIRVTMDRLASAQGALDAARRAQAPEWIVSYYEQVVKEMSRAYAENRGLTASLPACTGMTQNQVPPVFEALPATSRNGEILAYDKPLIVLIDEFSASAADIFPAMLQDNGRGVLVGARTLGAGGTVGAVNAGNFTEAIASYTASLVLRKEPVSIPGYPETRYIENVGTHPDIKLEYMTRDNLMQRGRPFVEGFTKIIVDQIRNAGGATAGK